MKRLRQAFIGMNVAPCLNSFGNEKRWNREKGGAGTEEARGQNPKKSWVFPERKPDEAGTDVRTCGFGSHDEEAKPAGTEVGERRRRPREVGKAKGSAGFPPGSLTLRAARHPGRSDPGLGARAFFNPRVSGRYQTLRNGPALNS